eukprot:15602372-Heterocapsa_arctica.AAC.1
MVAVCGRPGAFFLATTRAKMLSNVTPMNYVFVCSNIMPSVIEMPTVISSVINHHIVLVVLIPQAPSMRDDLLVALCNMSDQGV